MSSGKSLVTTETPKLLPQNTLKKNSIMYVSSEAAHVHEQVQVVGAHLCSLHRNQISISKLLFFSASWIATVLSSIVYLHQCAFFQSLSKHKNMPE